MPNLSTKAQPNSMPNPKPSEIILEENACRTQILSRIEEDEK